MFSIICMSEDVQMTDCFVLEKEAMATPLRSGSCASIVTDRVVRNFVWDM